MCAATLTTNHRTPPLDRSSICAVIVTFNPTEKLNALVLALQDQVGTILIVDNNSSNRMTVERLSGQVGEILWLDRNYGLGHGLNTGARRAVELGHTWLITFDQDSCPAPDMVARMADACRVMPPGLRVGALGPRRVKTADEIAQPPSARQSWQRRTYLITSGMLLPLAVFNEIGGYDGEYFIDMLDRELCARLDRHTYAVVMVRDACLIHRVGDPVGFTLLGRDFYSSNHSPVRRYYMYRNGIRLMTEHGLRKTHYVIYGLTAEFLFVLLAERNKIRKLRAIAAGMIDGVRRRSGPAPSPIA